MAPDLWGLPVKTCAYSDRRLWSRGLWLLGDSSPHYHCFVLQAHKHQLPFFFFCLSAYFSIHQVHFVSSQHDELEVGERELKNLYFKKERCSLSFAGSWIRDLPSGSGRDPQPLWEIKGQVFCLSLSWLRGFTGPHKCSTELLLSPPVSLLSGNLTLNLISVFHSKTED